MQKPKMRWLKKDVAEWAKIRKNHNAKVSRLEKDPTFTGILPDRIYKTDVTTRADYNRIKKQVDIFTSRGSEKIVKYKGQQIPFYEKKNVQAMVKSIAAKNAHKRKKLSHEGGTMGMNKDAEFLKPNLNKKRTQKEWEMFKKDLKAKYYDKNVLVRQSKYKETYLTMVDRFLGPYGKPIAELLEDVDPTILLEGSYQDALLTIQITSDPIEAELIGESVYNTWVYFLEDRQAMGDLEGELGFMEYEEMLEDTLGPGYHETLNKNIVNWSK